MTAVGKSDCSVPTYIVLEVAAETIWNLTGLKDEPVVE